MVKTLVILGACGGARETYWVVRETDPEIEVVFVEDTSEIREVPVAGRVIPVVKDWDFSTVRRDLARDDPAAFTQFIVGMSDTKVKKIVVEKALSHGLTPAPTVISPLAIVRSDCTIGRGGVIQQNSVLTTNITAGDYVIIHMARVGHDCVLGDYVTCSPGCNVAGHVRLDEGVFLGAATVVRQRLHIAPWVITGMQSCVVKDIEQPGIVMAGVPARQIVKAKTE